jgi:hypothetical protein
MKHSVSPSSRIVFLFTTHRGESVVKGTNYLKMEVNAIQIEYQICQFYEHGKIRRLLLIFFYYLMNILHAEQVPLIVLCHISLVDNLCSLHHLLYHFLGY